MKTLTGNEHFMYNGMPINYLLNDFWSWSSSELLNNTLRGALAEFIVATALGIDTSVVREDWAPFDLIYKNTIKIEVKSSAYLQSWEQQGFSKIQFSIRPTRSWSCEDGYSDEAVRQSDFYVFCLFSCTDRELASPLILEQWEFYILPTRVLNEICGSQKSITLQTLISLNAAKVSYDKIRDTIDVAQISPV